MRILQLCKKFPYPLKDGESIAITYLAKSLHALGHELTLLAMNTVKHEYTGEAHPAALSHYQSVHTVPIDNRVKPLHAFLNLFTTQSYHIQRFVSIEFERQLTALLQANDYDIIQLETIYLAPYIDTIRRHSSARIVLRAHNVEHEIWARIHENAAAGPRRWYLHLLTERLRRYELAQLRRIDALVAITQRDLAYFEAQGLPSPGTVAPIGTDLAHYQPDASSYAAPLSLSFIGSLDWMPNLEGLEWFIKTVMPKLAERLPQVALHIAGRNMPERLRAFASDRIVIHGEVPDSQAFLRAHSVMIVPLFSGSGMRAKIIEAMSLAKVVITTSLGLEGIPAPSGEAVWCADTAEAFVEAILRCAQSPAAAQAMGQAARDFIASHFDYMAVGEQLQAFYQMQIATNAVQP